MASISGTAFLLILAYFGLRIEKLDEIWVEIEQYNTKIERELAQYLWGVFQPYNDEITNRMESVIGNLSPDDQTDGGFMIPSSLEEPENDQGGDVEYNLENTDWDDFFPKQPDEVIEEMQDAFMDEGGPEFLEQEQTDEPMPAKYLVEQGHLNPPEIFDKVREMYKKYRRPERALLLIKTSLIGLIANCGVLLGISLFNFKWPTEAVIVFTGLTLLWIASELWLWYVLKQEVALEGKTPISKLMPPELREIFN